MTKIYLITNIDNDPNKVYIGKTSIGTLRKYNHFYKFGRQITFDFIDEVDSILKADWKYLESYWIAQFKAWRFNIVNKNEGGGGIQNHNIATKNYLSSIRKGVPKTKESVLKRAALLKGVALNKYNCEHCSKEIGGEGNFIKHTRSCLANPNRVITTMSTEHKLKISNSNKGVAGRKKGYLHSEETKQKMKLAKNKI